MKMKKIASVLVAAIAVACMSVSVFAASGINDAEQSILDALSAPVTNAAGAKASIPAGYVGHAREYFNRDGVDVTAAEADEVIASINTARDLAAASTAASMKDLPEDVKIAILDEANVAAHVLGLSVSYNPVTNSATITDAAGNVIFYAPLFNAAGGNGGVILQMGMGINFLWLVLAAAVVMAFAGFVVYNRRRAIAAK